MAPGARNGESRVAEPPRHPLRAVTARPRRPRNDAAGRIRHLIELDAGNVMVQLAERSQEMVALFSRLRDRTPLLAALHSWFPTITFGDLAKLRPGEQFAVNEFYRVLSELRWYVQYTEDMPLQLERRIGLLAARLRVSHGRLTETLGAHEVARSGSASRR